MKEACRYEDKSNNATNKRDLLKHKNTIKANRQSFIKKRNIKKANKQIKSMKEGAMISINTKIKVKLQKKLLTDYHSYFDEKENTIDDLCCNFNGISLLTIFDRSNKEEVTKIKLKKYEKEYYKAISYAKTLKNKRNYLNIRKNTKKIKVSNENYCNEEFHDINNFDITQLEDEYKKSKSDRKQKNLNIVKDLLSLLDDKTQISLNEEFNKTNYITEKLLKNFYSNYDFTELHNIDKPFKSCFSSNIDEDIKKKVSYMTSLFHDNINNYFNSLFNFSNENHDKELDILLKEKIINKISISLIKAERKKYFDNLIINSQKFLGNMYL